MSGLRTRHPHNHGGIVNILSFFVASVFLLYSTAVAQPAVDNLQKLGFDGQNPAHLMDVEVSGSKSYVSVGFFQGIETYDISNPYSPARISYTGSHNWRSRTYGDYLFTFNRDAGLSIYNISGQTTLVGSCNPSWANTLYEGGALIGDTMYVAAHQRGLVLVDVSNYANPSNIRLFTLSQNACWNVESSGNYLYIANGIHGLTIVEVTDELSIIAELDLPGLANDIVLDWTTAIISLADAGIAAVDISDPYNPQLLDIHPSLGCAWGMGIQNHLVSVGSWRVLELFDVSDPGDIQLVGWENTKTWAMGADLGLYQNEPMIAVADWKGIATYRYNTEVSPDIDVYPLRVDFGQTTSADTNIIIRNTGVADLVVSDITTPAGITLSSTSFTIPPGDSLQLTMTAFARQVMGSVHYICNDPDEADFVQHVFANNQSFPQVGSEALDFSLQGTDGVNYTLSELQGNVVFLEFGGGW